MADKVSPVIFGPPIMRVAGDMGLLIEFGDRYDPAISNAVLAFDARFGEAPPDGVIETVPTFRSFLVRFDPAVLAFERLAEVLQGLLEECNWYEVPRYAGGRDWVLPCVYGADRGPDLAEVADLMQLREDQVIDSHASAELTVIMLGFAPGLAYLAELPENWQFPRRTAITPEVPAGAVLAAIRQTVLPATPIPTGWWQIGQTPFRSLDVTAKSPFLLSPGDRVRFQPVDEAAFAVFDMAEFLAGAGR